MFLVGQATLLIARIGLKSTYNIACRKSNQHYQYEEQDCESFAFAHVFSIALYPGWHLFFCEDIADGIIPSCVRMGNQMGLVGQVCECLSVNPDQGLPWSGFTLRHSYQIATDCSAVSSGIPS